jgi:signal transduction histidine kinase/CheY-like chemotaxis protein
LLRAGADSYAISNIAINGSADQYFSHLEDSTGELSIREMSETTYLDLFSPGQTTVLNKGYSNSAFWLHARFHLDTDTQATRYFTLEYSLLDDVEFYVLQNGVVQQQWITGDSRPFNSRPIDHSNFLFPVEFNNAETTDIFIRVHSTSSMRMPITIWEPSAFYDMQRPKLLTDGLYYGILFLMFFYNLCLFATVRDPSYFYYIAYIFSMATVQLCMTGYGFEYFWSDSPHINEFMLPFSICTTAVFILAFAQRVLDLNKHAPLLYYFFTVFILLETAGALISLILPYAVVIQTVIVFAALVAIAMMYASTQLSLKGHSTAKLFLFAWFTLMCGSIALIATSFGWIGANFFTTNAFMIGSGIEVVVLSFALADRLHRINSEKSRIEKEAKRNLEEVNSSLLMNNKLKDDFLATISHELRTPMNGVLGCLQQIQQGGSQQKLDQYLSSADRSARQMMMLVDSLLAYTELQSGKLSVQNDPFKIYELLENSRSLFNETCIRKGIQLNVTINEETPQTLFNDHYRLSQILNNLIDNAIKFTHHGQIDVRVNSHDIQPDSQLLQLDIEVSDTGIGIDADKQTLIFDTFHRGEGNLKRGYGGLGIGLSVIKALLDKMGGSISFQSQPDQGSTFTISLPCHYQSNEVTRRFDEKTQQRQNQTKTLSVLVVEDNPVNQLVVKGLLSKHGYQVFSASNGVQAIEALEQQSFDLILMDCQMPIMDGFEATRHIRNLPSTVASVPIIAVTANAMSEDRHLCLEVGMNDYLCKPIDAQILNRKIIYWANKPINRRAI